MINRREILAAIASSSMAGVGIGRVSRANQPGQILFSQPSYTDGIAPHFSVTNAQPSYNPIGVFYLHANQPNPYSTDSAFVPVLWDAATMTGLQVPYSRLDWQRGIATLQNPLGRTHTTAQIYGDTVGAYLNSADLFNGSPGNRMMVSANYQFPQPSVVFAGSQSLMGVSLELQVPTATDYHLGNLSNTYAKIDLLFICTKGGARLSYSCGLFVNGTLPPHDSTGYDDLTFTVIVAAQVSPVGKLVTLRPGSATQQAAPWTGFKTFSFTIAQAQFAAGLASAAPVAQAYGYQLSLDPADYVLSTTHLNAELHYTAATPATLGWSMRNLLLTQLA